MSKALTELIAVLEEEIAVGEELLLNLDAQRKAILSWDIVSLIDRMEAKEHLLHSLGHLEEKRSFHLAQLASDHGKTTLRELIAGLSDNAESDRLRSLQEPIRQIFERLATGETNLMVLMENIQSHISEALSAIIQPSVPLYGETGTATQQRAASGLIQGKA